MPLTEECKRVLNFATEEADQLHNKHIGTEHLLLGLLREEGCFAAKMLKDRGAEITEAHRKLATFPPPGPLGRRDTGPDNPSDTDFEDFT